MNWFWNTVEDGIRQVLLKVTEPIPDRDLAGYAFGIGLVITDNLLRPLKWMIR